MQTRIGQDISEAAQILSQEEVVAIPTETVYGLAGLCTSSKAIASIYRIKKRPYSNPLILHSSSLQAAEPWTGTLSEDMQDLADHFWPGPLTLLVPKGRLLSEITAQLPRIALRVPSHPTAQALLRKLPAPVAAPSANISGYISPTSAPQVASQLSGRISYILDGGPSDIGLESTIVGFENGFPILYRSGAISVEEIEALLGRPLLHSQTVNLQAPGMQSNHYAPRKPLLLGDTARLLSHQQAGQVGILRFSSPQSGIPLQQQLILSESGDLQQAAARLFSSLHKLDHMKISLILAEPVPNKGIGEAINDRLRRAAQNKKAKPYHPKTAHNESAEKKVAEES